MKQLPILLILVVLILLGHVQANSLRSKTHSEIEHNQLNEGILAVNDCATCGSSLSPSGSAAPTSIEQSISPKPKPKPNPKSKPKPVPGSSSEEDAPTTSPACPNCALRRSRIPTVAPTSPAPSISRAPTKPSTDQASSSSSSEEILKPKPKPKPKPIPPSKSSPSLDNPEIQTQQPTMSPTSPTLSFSRNPTGRTTLAPQSSPSTIPTTLLPSMSTTVSPSVPSGIGRPISFQVQVPSTSPTTSTQDDDETWNARNARQMRRRQNH